MLSQLVILVSINFCTSIDNSEFWVSSDAPSEYDSMDITSSKLFRTFSESSKQAIFENLAKNKTSKSPTSFPTQNQSFVPTKHPTNHPTTIKPTNSPIQNPTQHPSISTAPRKNDKKKHKKSKTHNTQEPNIDDSLLDQKIQESKAFKGKIKVFSVDESEMDDFESELIHQQNTDLFIFAGHNTHANQNSIYLRPGQYRYYSTDAEFCLYSCIFMLTKALGDFGSNPPEVFNIWISYVLPLLSVSNGTMDLFKYGLNSAYKFSHVFNATYTKQIGIIFGYIYIYDSAKVQKGTIPLLSGKILKDEGTIVTMIHLWSACVVKSFNDIVKELEQLVIYSNYSNNVVKQNMHREWRKIINNSKIVFNAGMNSIVGYLHALIIDKDMKSMIQLQNDLTSLKEFSKSFILTSNEMRIAATIYDWKMNSNTTQKDICVVLYMIDTLSFDLVKLIKEISKISQRPIIVERYLIKRKDSRSLQHSKNVKQKTAKARKCKPDFQLKSFVGTLKH